MIEMSGSVWRKEKDCQQQCEEEGVGKAGEGLRANVLNTQLHLSYIWNQHNESLRHIGDINKIRGKQSKQTVRIAYIYQKRTQGRGGGRTFLLSPLLLWWSRKAKITMVGLKI